MGLFGSLKKELGRLGVKSSKEADLMSRAEGGDTSAAHELFLQYANRKMDSWVVDGKRALYWLNRGMIERNPRPVRGKVRGTDPFGYEKYHDWFHEAGMILVQRCQAQCYNDMATYYRIGYIAIGEKSDPAVINLQKAYNTNGH